MLKNIIVKHQSYFKGKKEALVSSSLILV